MPVDSNCCTDTLIQSDIGSNTAKGMLRLKLAGPADKLAQGWMLLQSTSPNCPKGIEIDPPTAVGRYLGCEHRLSTQFVEWQGELPTTLDPPPPKVRRTHPSQTRAMRRKRGVTRRPAAGARPTERTQTGQSHR
eukprot:1399927-Pyramimonas_sp.AAC.1